MVLVRRIYLVFDNDTGVVFLQKNIDPAMISGHFGPHLEILEYFALECVLAITRVPVFKAQFQEQLKKRLP